MKNTTQLAVLSWFPIAGIKIMTKTNLGMRVFLTYLSKPSLKGTKTRAVEECSLLVRSQDLLRVLSYTIQDHLLA